METDYNNIKKLYQISDIDLLSLSIPQTALLYILLRNMQNNRLKNTFLVRKDFFGLNHVLLLLIKYCMPHITLDIPSENIPLLILKVFQLIGSILKHLCSVCPSFFA